MSGLPLGMLDSPDLAREGDQPCRIVIRREVVEKVYVGDRDVTNDCASVTLLPFGRYHARLYVTPRTIDPEDARAVMEWETHGTYSIHEANP